jgi:hypothetical protein
MENDSFIIYLSRLDGDPFIQDWRRAKMVDTTQQVAFLPIPQCFIKWHLLRKPSPDTL